MRPGKGNCAGLAGTMWRKGRMSRVPDHLVGFYAKLMSYCADNETDGYVPRDVLLSVGKRPPWYPGDITGYVTECVSELVAVEKLEDHGDQVLVVDYLEYNFSRSEISERREKNREKQARYRSRRGSPSESVTGNVDGNGDRVVTGRKGVGDLLDQKEVSDDEIATRHALSARAVRVASEGYREATGVYPSAPPQDIGPKLLDFAQGTDPDDWEVPLRVAARNAASAIEGKDVRSWWRIFSRNAHQYVRRVA